ncbi:MBL fold metallo-hydrolase RNA specificity domain-containing protein [Yanshouia hominis]|uniref:MBL fold metallo-hydrolase n=1 Tax=Yanshouia hominis TaxID=2763673 RepID=A0ABR7NKM2_9FIRM|nr:MBL fold metallo-hydrolase [Yanshouia hominis]MBC8576962.1 MBL fold metallo-hydrolase [Yanshouia hominis]
MQLTFLGATHEVTGSCFYLTACGKKIVIDCGMEQGPNYFENQEIPVAAGEVDYVLLTHAHIDHSGMLPLLCKNGFSGEIHSTDATADLCSVMLRDSAHIQEFEAEWRNRKAQRAGREPYVPIYTMDDAVAAIGLFVPHFYDQKFALCEGVEVRFTDVGHLLGSASIEIWVTEGDVTKKVVFSGDIGNLHQPIIRDPQYIADADYVVMESTYGDRSHGPRPDYISELSQIMQRTFDRGGNVVIPSFAVGRTQEMLYFLRQIKEERLVTGHDFSVYVDSPLAVEATNIFRENGAECYDDETRALIQKGINPISFAGLKVSVSAEESKAINFDASSKVILSASGMCDAGRIKHHLKHNLWRRESTILFVGYQAVGSLGRQILEGAETVKLFGEAIEVKAEIARLAGVSGHADKEGLLTWIGHFSPKPQRVFVVHGDDAVCEAFTAELTSRGFSAVAPYSGSSFDLATNVCLVAKGPVPIKKDYAARRAQSTFERLLAAGKRLLTVIEHNKGGTNKDLARFASQIDSLCDKWDR